MSAPHSYTAQEEDEAGLLAFQWCEIRTEESYGPQGKNLGILARAVNELNLRLSEANRDKEAMSARIFNLERTHGPSLPQGQRNAIIEECAKVAQPNMEPSDDRWEKGYWAAQNSISHAIRGLKHYDPTGERQP